MAGLLGNIAGALGNNLSHHAHRLHEQNFQQSIEEQRAARAEKLAQRSREWQLEDLETQRGWQLEDREQAGLLQQQSQQFKSQEAALDRMADLYGSDGRKIQENLTAIAMEIADTAALNPETAERLQSVLADSQSQLEHVINAAQQSGVVDRAGLRAIESYMAQLQAELDAKAEAARAEQEEQRIKAEIQAENAAALREAGRQKVEARSLQYYGDSSGGPGTGYSDARRRDHNRSRLGWPLSN